MPQLERIYLDHAATSWPKSPAVLAAMLEYLRDNGAPAGRSGYREAIAVDRQIQMLRADLARLIAAPSAERIVFGFNGTDVLNLAIHGILRPGDHVVTTAAEHNSVLRPLAWEASRERITVDYAPCDGAGRVDPDAVRRLIRPGQTRLVALLHASNVTGAVQPIDDVGQLAHAAGALLLVDAAQTLGQWPVSVHDSPIDLLAAPGHKCLGGPLGTGLLYIAPGLEAELEPVRQGGTGSRSDEPLPPETLPDRYEAGNHNVPGLVGLAAAARDWTATDVLALRDRYRRWTAQARTELAAIPGVRCYGPQNLAEQVGVVSFSVEGFDPHELAVTLDAAFRIQCRAGLHCAPRVHRALGTWELGGTVRVSWGRETTADMVARVVAAVGELAGGG